MTDHFDPYHKWLGIPPAEQPPDLYRLLGIVRFESDPDVIANAADQRMAHLRHFQAGAHSTQSQRLLNEVAAARVVLLHAERKMAYDLELDAEQPGVPEAAAPPVVPPPLPPPVDGDVLPSLSIDDDPQEYRPPLSSVLPPPPLAPISYSPVSDHVEDRLESLPYHPDFEPVDAIDADPGWESTPPQTAYDSPAASTPPPSSIGMETRQWLDNLLENLGVSGAGHDSTSFTRPWEQPDNVGTLPLADDWDAADSQPTFAPLGVGEAIRRWFDHWPGLSAASEAAICAIALTAMLFALSLSVLAATPFPAAEERRWIMSHPARDDLFDEIDDLDGELLDLPMGLSMEVVSVDVALVTEQLKLLPNEDTEPLRTPWVLSDFGVQHAPRSELLTQVGVVTGEGYGGRSDANHAAMGATGASEAAVALALQWFANHQLPDGSWSFDHTIAPSCQGKCKNPGSLREARNAATGMALLAFLGAGQTHRTGKYKQNVRVGLYYLISKMKMSNKGGSLHENGGSMYSHGLAAIALCEACGMTRDRSLFQPAQAAVNYICYAQDPVGGGWRYEPRQAGDMSVVGWQLMALKTAHMSYLQVPPEVIKKAFVFLDGVQAAHGAAYGYTGPGEGPATTSVGLLCRMHLGWNKDNPALQRGVDQVSTWGISKGGDLYYDYYATQVARHWEGDVWEKWNGQMHDWLVNSQGKRGHEAGSWYFRGERYGDRGGRHYITAMATMMLEAYYRYMPIYRKPTTEDDFAS